ncbi:MAG: hypothetical protein IT529_21545 [Burkholderiales bacterium]|nr:hypothetical protein [Burkholderiales bacterium]
MPGSSSRNAGSNDEDGAAATNIAGKLWAVLRPIARSFDSGGLLSYDPYDIYETAAGRLSKRLWSRDNRLAFLIAAPLVGIDIVFPALRTVLSRQREHPICHAHAGLGYLALSELLPAQAADYQEAALREAEWLRANARQTSSGIGWGLNLRWETKSGYMAPNTPCHTQTAYAYLLFDRLYARGLGSGILETLAAIAEHTAHDFKQFTEPSSGARISGYSMMDTRPVVNAQSYRAAILVSAHERFDVRTYLECASESVRYILRTQREDGSWLYSPNEPFVDHYHTCFILKNLVAVADTLWVLDRAGRDTMVDAAEVTRAIERGYSFYRRELFNSEGGPRPFARTNKPALHVYDAYDFAEAINLLSLFGDWKGLEPVIDLYLLKMQLRNGLGRYRYFYGLSRLTEGLSYHRYANSATFLAALNALSRLKSDDRH